ncbi:fimbrial protein [Photorhabdus hindustanensis]|uniref:Type 1 fimbrial protein n=1 Tax=Photorhabdus hindustanensis TaxID=2918802 RepID=A0A2S8PY26_9GAMM|nr:fimbrial protein [Photorhabdus hindustanensis]PQQ23995.1 type 1 fimbrial protein [Photorhabdus hindustanensis]
MKKNFILVSLVAALGIFSSFSALSYDGTIKFRGTIINEGCTINVPDSGTVNFGKLSKNVFGGKTNTVGISKDFSISLTACPKDGAVGISFDGEPNIHNKSFYASGLDGVGIQISNADSGTEIKPREHATGVATITSNTATMKFIAKLISTNNSITAGAINKDINFTIIYP